MLTIIAIGSYFALNLLVSEMSKAIYISITLLLTSIISYSQAHRYIMPDTLPSIHVYCFMTIDGLMTPIKQIRENTYINNTLVMNIINKLGQQTTSTNLRYLNFTNDEVRVSYSKTTNALVANSERIFNPPAILLKVPKDKETVIWTNKENGERYMAKHVTIMDGGISRKLLAVYNFHENDQLVQYYLLGFGLWQTAIIKNGKETILYRLIY